MTPISSARSPGGVIRFGVFELDAAAGELRKRGLRLPIQGIPVQILAILAGRPGELVTRDELRAQLWPADTFVDFDHGIRNAIARLREVLGDSAETPRYIETLPRRGYRFIASIESEAPAAAKLVPAPPAKSRSRLWLAAGVASVLAAAGLGWFAYLHAGRRNASPITSPIQSIAVIPLENLTGNADQEYFVDGMTDELITSLAKINSLKVVSRTSSMHYKQVRESLPNIAKELNVDAIVEGTVSRSGNRIRIRVQLIDARGDRHLWAEDYDRQLGDVVKLQNDISRDVAAQIRAQLPQSEQQGTSRQRSVNPEAYEAYLKGRFHWNKRTDPELKIGIDYFNQAIAADPQYALPYVGLADSYNILGSGVFTAVPPSEAREKALMYAQKALALDDSLGEAHASLGAARELFDWDWAASEAELKRAIAMSPSYANGYHWYANLLVNLRRFPESIEISHKAKELDPLAPLVHASFAERLCAAGQLEEARREAATALELDPQLPLAHTYLGEIYRQQKDYAAAIAEFKKAAQFSNNNPNSVADLGFAYGVSGDQKRARDVLKDLEEMAKKRLVSAYQFAVVYAGLGERAKAMAALERAYQEHSPWMDHLYRDNRLNSLRGEPQFVELVKALKFPG